MHLLCPIYNFCNYPLICSEYKWPFTIDHHIYSSLVLNASFNAFKSR